MVLPWKKKTLRHTLQASTWDYAREETLQQCKMKSTEIPFGDHLVQLFAKYCFGFFFYIKKYVLFPHKGKWLCIHLSPWLTWFELRYSRPKPIQLFPGTENISQLIRNWHLLPSTNKSNLSENELFRKRIVHHHIFLFHFYVGWIKKKKQQTFGLHTYMQTHF